MASEWVSAKRPAWTIPSWLRGLAALALLAGVLALLAHGLARTRSLVIVDVDGQLIRVRTHATTVDAVLNQANIDLYPEDILSPGREALLQAGQPIEIRRARPVALSADGQIVQLRTHVTTVGEFLAEAGVRIGPGDELGLHESAADAAQRPGYGRMVAADTALLAEPAGIPPLITLRRATPVLLHYSGVTTTLHTTADTVGQVVQDRGLILFLGDEITPSLQARLTPGTVIAIRRSLPVQIEVDGNVIHTRTLAENVAGVLGQERIALVGRDTVQPGLDQPIRSGTTICVTRVHEELAVEFEPIPFGTIWVADPAMEIDQRRLVQEGQIGLTKSRTRIVYHDGHEVSRSLEDTWAEQSPITKTLAYGTKIVIRILDTPDGPIEYWRKMRVYTTAYTAASAGKPKTHPRYGYTRLGWKAVKGVVATDPTVIPLRTKMYIPGYGFGTAGDTGGGVKGKFVDLCFDEGKYQSWHWWTDIYLLTPVPPSSQIRWLLPDWPKYPDRRR